MDEVARFMEWDLQAIVKGSTSEEAPVAAATIIDNLYLNNSPHHHHHHHFCSEQQEMFFNFHEFSATTSVFDELEELYKPFYPVLDNNNTINISTVTSSIPIPDPEQVKVLELKPPADRVTAQDSKEPAPSKCKRRKKNGKRRVKEVTEVEAFSDGWAWRKYGQKPIKGSPYPRSYYRCSSSKGCLSRKQVERSHLDPQVFIVTYTAEHTHPQPTRRNKNSLAGTTRKSTTSFMIAASSRTVDNKSSAVEDHGYVLPTTSVGDEEQSNNSGNWFQSIELEEELNGLELDDQLLIDLDGCGFMDTFGDDTWFNSSIDLT